MNSQSVVEIIVYLLETITSHQMDATSDPALVRQKLEEAGFARETIINTFDWLQELIEQQNWYVSPNACRTLRIFSLEETYRINLEIRSFILSLEHIGVLDTKMREIVINQLMKLQQPSIDLIDAKWIVFFVLISRSNKNTQNLRSYLLSAMAQNV